MELLYIAAAFAVVFILLNLKFPLVLGMLGGTGLLLILFGISPVDFGSVALDSVTSWSTLEVVLALYIINVLQGILERRKRLELAQQAMNRLLRDQRLNTALASIFIGMMPAPSAVTICGQMMDEMAGDHLTKAEKACCASYYRHITEGVLPTYPTVIIVCSLSGVATSSFVLTMLPMVAVLIALGFVYYLRKVPKSSPQAPQGGAPSTGACLQPVDHPGRHPYDRPSSHARMDGGVHCHRGGNFCGTHSPRGTGRPVPACLRLAGYSGDFCRLPI